MSKINSWENITIAKFREIVSIAKDEELNEQEKDIKLIALINDMTEEEVWNTQINEISKLKENLQFLNEEPKAKDKKYKTYVINEMIYDVITDMNKFTYGQYMDFQTHYQEEDNIAKVLSVILVPKGHKYGDGYDLVELMQEIDESVNIIDAKSLCFFFVKSLQNLIKSTLDYLEKVAKGKTITTLNKEKREMIELKLREIKQLQSLITFL